MGGEDVEVYAVPSKNWSAVENYLQAGSLITPMSGWSEKTKCWHFFSEGDELEQALVGQPVEVILPETGFYIESGGQVSDAAGSCQRRFLGRQRGRSPSPAAE